MTIGPSSPVISYPDKELGHLTKNIACLDQIPGG